MNVLLITSKEEDYLQDSIIHGFKELYGKEAIDYPVKPILYNDCVSLNNIRGNGFTLYALLDKNLKSDIQLNIENDITANKFKLIIFTSIHRQYNLFYKYFKLLKNTTANVWIMDGEDTPALFPYMGKQLKKFLFSPKPHRYFIYFKREITPETLNRIYFKLPVDKVKKIALPDSIKTISFSIPSEKIISYKPIKNKLFTRHIVDEEIRVKLNVGSTLFETEDEYYKDIQSSQFGISTKRAGWDCLRHYEIAANGTVICFKHLNEKPAHCAPHGLVDGENCISYSNYTNLMDRINSLSDESYNTLQQNSINWVHKNSTKAKAKELIKKYFILE